MDTDRPAQPQPGLCQACVYAREIISAKGSRFLYCSRAEEDDRYAKYPRLPVLECPGYTPRSGDP
jgi:hypothetical protein